MTRKHLLLCGVSALSIGMMTAATFAQDAMETVVVTGIRASLQSAQALKENANQVVDSITATDIGALPDRNVAEALQRVPGVTLQRNDSPNDLTRMGSTGNSVFIRGLSWVQTTMNGRAEFSAVDGRTLSFADISADLMAGVDVYKSPTAKMIEGGIGGIIDLKTRKPFDNDGRKIAFSGDYTYGDLADRALPSGNALYSDRWNTSIGEFGFLASVDWQDQLTRTAGVNLNPFDCWDSAGTRSDATAGSAYSSCMSDTKHLMAPNGYGVRQMDFRQQRLASNVVLQYRPNEHWEFTLSGLNSYAHFNDAEHFAFFSQSSYATQIKTARYDEKANWTGGTANFSNIDLRAGTGHNRTSDLNFNAKWNPDDNWEISTDFQFVESDRQYLNNTMYTALTHGSLNMDNDISSGTPVLSWADDGTTSQAKNYQWNAAMDHMDYNSAHAFTGRLDASYKFNGDGLFGLFKSVDTGFRTEQKVSVARSTGYNWVALCPTSWGGANGGCPTLDGTVAKSYPAIDGSTVSQGSQAVAKVNSYAQLFSYSKVFGNSMPNFYAPSPGIASMNTVQSNALFNTIMPANNWNWISYASAAGCSTGANCLAAYYNTTNGYNVTGNRVSPQKQATYAGYVQANYAADRLFGYDIPVDGNIGVRFVRTRNDISNGKLVLPALNGNLDKCTIGQVMKPSDPTTAITSCADFNTALAFWGTKSNGTPASAALTVDRPSVKNDYTNILPSFNFRAKLSDTVQARLGYSETMLRPDFSYTQNNATLQFNWDDQQTSRAYTFKSTPSGYGGNPNLKPMHSFNYDASVEWYFSETGSVTASVFAKKISNYIFTSTTTTNITNPYSGASYPFAYTTYVNGTKGGVDGWELAYQQFFDMLPGIWSGFGVQANYTKIYNWGGHNGAADTTSTAAINNAGMDLPMEGMSHDSYNLALMYAKYDVDFRLAWNWRSAYLSSTSNSNEPKEPVWMENYGQLDSSLFYTFFDHYKAGVQVTNITGANFYTDEGYKDYHPRVNWIKADRKFAFVVRASW